ncbi:Metallo-dependent phosphatase [Hesseltinella vesiculosa]|uniref:Purple acid phosphatase n=1 Tax=Hesseltinella vesiculosa TaxID=101127 RepID=A0A1X2G9J8_9FUNG|nr:Metallo-dependent phosphatase [Hesseltinella vesiculosa]
MATSTQPGSPGVPAAPDNYNSFSNWNVTYAGPAPQQVHLSLTDDSKYVQVEFTTLENVSKACFKYWPKTNSGRPVTVTRGNDWAFVDGGAAKRTTYLHKFQSKRLQLATVYEYQVGTVPTNTTNTTTLWSSTFEFHTADRTDSFKFVAIGDLGINNAVTAKSLTNLADSHEYDFITVSGDQGYNLEDENGEKGDEYLNFMQQVYSKLPFMGVIGNHEDAYNYTHYVNRFNNVPFEQSNSPTPLLYSFNYKSLHLVSFTTEAFFLNKFGSPEQIAFALNWLDQDLTKANKHRSKRPWIIVISHHPIYCSSSNSDCITDAPMLRSYIEPVLAKHNVDIFLTGHVHNYERTYPVHNGTLATTSYHNAPSFFQIVNGDAGQPGDNTAFNSSITPPDWSAARYSGYGYSVVDVSPSTLNFGHYQVNTDGSLGSAVDQFTVTKS